MEDLEAETQFYTNDFYNKSLNCPKNTENRTELHNYFMTQFNMELESKQKRKVSLDYNDFQNSNEESFNFDVMDSWNVNTQVDTGLAVIDAVLENENVDQNNIKEVLLDLDSIGSEEKRNLEVQNQFSSTDYIDDESLIDELCREESDYGSTPDLFNEDNITPNLVQESLPSVETAFSKFYNYNTEQSFTPTQQTAVHNLECYTYPNSYLQNIDNKYALPDTPTSCTEFSYDKNERKISVSESIDSDIQSCSYYDGNSETFDEDDIFVNLDDFGLQFEAENEVVDVPPAARQYTRTQDKVTFQGERHCLWEGCHYKYPNQNTLVEHIERVHVNSYKGDEFSCLWKSCARNRRPFNARYKLLIHMRVHSGHKPNRCPHPGCGKAFSRLENLKIHVRSHTGEKPYACPAPHCRKAFSNSSDRAKHQRTHFNARPYACGAAGCGKRYTDPSSLRKHVKSHPHETNIPRTCISQTRPVKRDQEQLVPSSPAKLATLRIIRDKLTIPKLIRL